ncbi:hypothetical protein B0H14DRAFT_2342247 [Mycena olivaceomarginata]|nr:hypothetical protein B0H14DRAFT_2342247 [Mycena olivaceomarginata]
MTFQFYATPIDHSQQALTGERIHDQCFVCGPKGAHYQPPLPPYPEEWDFFINDRKTAAVSRKLNNIFSLTAIADYILSPYRDSSR